MVQISLTVPQIIQCREVSGSDTSGVPEGMRENAGPPTKTCGDPCLVTKCRGDPICHFEIIAYFSMALLENASSSLFRRGGGGLVRETFDR